MLYLSSLLQTTPIYQAAADRLSAALASQQIPFRFLTGAKDIWLRDFMPVQIRDGTFVSFCYDQGYLQNTPELKTDYEKDIAPPAFFGCDVFLHQPGRRKCGVLPIQGTGGHQRSGAGRKSCICSPRAGEDTGGAADGPGDFDSIPTQ